MTRCVSTDSKEQHKFVSSVDWTVSTQGMFFTHKLFFFCFSSTPPPPPDLGSTTEMVRKITNKKRLFWGEVL